MWWFYFKCNYLILKGFSLNATYVQRSFEIVFALIIRKNAADHKESGIVELARDESIVDLVVQNN